MSSVNITYDKIMLLYCYPYPANVFVLQISVTFYVCCIFSNTIHGKLVSTLKANIMDPDQTASLGAV